MDLTGCLLTADAAHCQKATAEAIVAAGGDYLLTLKANRGSLLKAVIPLLDGADAEWAGRAHVSVERGHGRTEQRSVRLTPATGVDFPHAAQVFRTMRHTGGLDGQRTRKQVVYGITNLSVTDAGPADIAADQRGHWHIETARITYATRHSMKTAAKSAPATRRRTPRRWATWPSIPCAPPATPISPTPVATTPTTTTASSTSTDCEHN